MPPLCVIPADCAPVYRSLLYFPQITVVCQRYARYFRAYGFLNKFRIYTFNQGGIRMKHPWKRLVCVLCALALCVSLVPFSALAEPAVSSSVVSQPAASTSSDVAEDLDEGSVPEVTPTPEATSAPESTTTPDGTAAPEATASPEATADPAAAAPAANDAANELSDAANGARASQTISVKVGETVSYQGSSSAFATSHSWKVTAGSANVSISGSSSRVQITGKQVGTAILKHTYWVPLFGTQSETIYVNVTSNSAAGRPVYLFVAKPGNTTLSDNGSDYYYLAHGGAVSSLASTSMAPVRNTTNESVITQYVTTWPTDLDFLTGTSSDPVGRDSTWTIDPATGEITSFSLWLGGTNYTSEEYGLRWAKFSYADTSDYGSQFHADAILYEKQTVDKVLDDLDASKELSDFSLNDDGTTKSSETFSFVLVDVDEATNRPLGAVNIPLTATLTQTGSAGRTELDAGSQGSTVLSPGRYMIYETGANGSVWQEANTILFDLNTNGTIKVYSDSTTITNTPQTYSLSYNLKGGNADSAFNTVSSLKYNAKTNVASKTPVKSDSVFMGWSTTDGGDVVYQPGDPIQIKGNVKLYAVWAPVSVTKAPVLSNTPADGIDMADYATVISENGKYVTYTTDGTAEILYKVTVNAYQGATVKATDTPTGGTVSFLKAVGATKSDDTTFTMTASTATLYYVVSVTGVEDKATVKNQIAWTIDSQSNTAKADDVTVIKTDKTAKVEKSITLVTRDDGDIDPVTDATILREGDVVSYQIKVTNTGKVALDDLVVGDTIHAAGTLPTKVSVKINDGAATEMDTTWTAGTKGNYSASWTISQTLEPGDVVTITYDYTVVAADASTATTNLRNTASTNAKEDPTSKPTTDNVVEVPAIQVAKTGTPQVSADGKMQIAYTVTVTNKGNAALTQTDLKDYMFPEEATDITVEIDGEETPNVSRVDGLVRVQDTLDVDSVMTLSYVYTVTETPEADGTLTVENTVEVTSYTEDLAYAEGTATAKTEVYSGTVDLALAPIVVYTGGDGFDQAIVGSDGNVVSSSNSGLPIFGFTMTLPDNTPVSVADNTEPVAAHLYDIEDDGTARVGYSWSAIAYNDNATVLMQLTPENDSSKVRIQLTDDKNQVVTSDDFNVGDALCETYTTELYVSNLDTTIIAEVDGKYYNVSYTNSTLTVRGTTDRAETNEVVNDASQLDSSVNVPQAVLPSDTTYSYVSENGSNGGQLAVADTSSVSLLVDEIVDQAVETDQQYVQMMKDKVEAAGGLLGPASANANRTWRFFYMDLVLANNGNAVLTADKDVTIYWPYSQTNGLTYENVTSGQYKVSVVHYVGLNRNYTSDSFATELNDCNAVAYTVEATPQGLRFTVPAKDGFSPYALVYETNTQVTPTSTPGATATPTATAAPAVGVPATGDSTPLAAMIGIVAAAAIALIVLVVVRQRRRKQQ